MDIVGKYKGKDFGDPEKTKIILNWLISAEKAHLLFLFCLVKTNAELIYNL